MSSRDPVDEQIAAAITSGELAATRGTGRPIENLDRDPMWWVKQLLKREKAADGVADAIKEYDRATDLAVATDTLSDARAILAEANEGLAAWNAEVGDEFQVAVRNEIWLLTERENARR